MSMTLFLLSFWVPIACYILTLFYKFRSLSFLFFATADPVVGIIFKSDSKVFYFVSLGFLGRACELSEPSSLFLEKTILTVLLVTV